jgi:hypothetical protein
MTLRQFCRKNNKKTTMARTSSSSTNSFSSLYTSYSKSQLEKIESGVLRPGQLLTGKDVKHISFWIVLSFDLIHDGKKYKRGLNKLDQPWNPQGESEPGGICVTYDFPSHLQHGDKISRVVIPDEALVWTESYNQIKTTAIILVKIEEIKHAHIDWHMLIDQKRVFLWDIPFECHTNQIYISIVRNDAYMIRYIPKKISYERDHFDCCSRKLFHTCMRSKRNDDD